VREAADCAAARSGVSISGAARRGAARLLLPPIRSADWPLCSSPRSAPRQCVRPSVRPFRLYRSEETTGLVQGLRGRHNFFEAARGRENWGKENRQSNPAWCHSGLVSFSSLEPTRGKFFGASTTSLEPADRDRLPRRGAVYYMEWDTGIYSAPDQPRDPRCERTGRRDAGGKCMQIDAVVISSCDTIYTRD
jgi:hypothetical protein